MTSPRVCVVLASLDARSTIAASVERFVEEVGDRGEVVVVDASRDRTSDVVPSGPGVRLIRRPQGSLVPELWRDGFEASDAPLVAFSTASMVPAIGWLDALLLRMKVTGAAAVGGPIEPAAGLSETDRAVYLLRYLNYHRPVSPATTCEPPGDNALYRRDALAGLGPWMARGFWEAAINGRLREAGLPLVMSEGGLVHFHGGIRLAEALRQRHRHARNYGATCAEGMGAAERWSRAAASPMVPLLLARRMAGAFRAKSLRGGPWWPALPSLSLLLAAWAAGEARGTCAGHGPPIRAA